MRYHKYFMHCAAVVVVVVVVVFGLHTFCQLETQEWGDLIANAY